MEIYLMRHAEPVAPTTWPGPDTSRPLSDRGRKQLDEAINAMKRKGFRPQMIFTSPFERARETAEKMAALTEGQKPIIKQDLASGSRTGTIRRVLEKVKNLDFILMVGHMPDLALFGAGVVSQPSLIEQGQKPGEIWAIETGAFETGWGTGSLLWKRNITDWNHD